MRIPTPGLSATTVTAAAVIAAALAVSCAAEPAPAGGPVARAFAAASAETGVPEPLLRAVGFHATRWRTPQDEGHGADGIDGHDTGRHGLMGIADTDAMPWMTDVARELAVPDPLDDASNIRVAAHVLARLANKETIAPGADPSTWAPTLARYGAMDDIAVGDLYARSVLAILERGAEGATRAGEFLSLAKTSSLSSHHVARAAHHVQEEGVVEFLSAREGFFTVGRTSELTHVIIHDIEGSYESAIWWFRDPSNPFQTSAHFIIRSSDGEITQMVHEEDTAHHIGGWNPWSIGIEHEGYAATGDEWFTDTMYRSSAALTRRLCLKYGIPMDREHIVGHVEVPGATHTDPGPHWDWTTYMAYVNDPTITGDVPCLDVDLVAACADVADAEAASELCPTRGTTRAELAEALLTMGGVTDPAVYDDAFTDDDSDPREPWLNAAFHFGVLVGANGLATPGGAANRSTLAVMLARLYALPPAASDHFDDDVGANGDGAHDRVVEAGLLYGCAADAFCGGDDATRALVAEVACGAAALGLTSVVAAELSPPVADAGAADVLDAGTSDDMEDDAGFVQRGEDAGDGATDGAGATGHDDDDSTVVLPATTTPDGGCATTTTPGPTAPLAIVALALLRRRRRRA